MKYLPIHVDILCIPTFSLLSLPRFKNSHAERQLPRDGIIMSKMVILIKNGKYSNFMATSILASGAAAADMDVVIFAMEDAVYYLKNDQYMAPPKFESPFPEFTEKMEAAANSDMVTPWYDLIRELKEFTEIKFIVCSMISDALGLKKDDFPDFIDMVAGVATFAAEADGAEIILTL